MVKEPVEPVLLETGVDSAFDFNRVKLVKILALVGITRMPAATNPPFCHPTAV